jgi:predicted GNAT family acetyltransferase
MDTLTIEHVADEQRYTAMLDGAEIGYADYRDAGGARHFLHTVVQPEHGGHGYATTLVDFAVHDSIDAGLGIVGECPMVAHWLTKHPELADSVVATD